MPTHHESQKRKEGEDLPPPTARPEKRAKTADENLRDRILHDLRILKGVPMKCHPLSTSPTLMNIELSNFNACYNAEVTRRLRVLEDTAGTRGIIENLALVEPNEFEMKNKYFCRREEPRSTATRFFLVGTVTNSSLLSGDISRNLSVSFSNRTFPRAIAVIGDILSEKTLFLPTFQQGVSITTTRRPTKGTGQATIRGLTSSSHHPRKHDDTEQPLLPWDAKVPIYNGTQPFQLSQYKNLPQIIDEITPNSAVITIFTLSTYPYHRLSSALQNQAVNVSLTFNIQSVIWVAFPSKEATVDPSISPSPPIGVTNDYLVDDTTNAMQTDIVINENEDLI